MIKIGSNCEYLVDDVFNADDAGFAENLLNLCVAGNCRLKISVRVMNAS